MFNSLYTYYNLYNVIIYIRGIYISYLPLMWIMATSYTYTAYMNILITQR